MDPRKNSFGHKIYTINQILENQDVYDLICDVLTFQSLTVTGDDNIELVKKFLDNILSEQLPNNLARKVRSKAVEMMGGENGLQKVRDIRVEDIIYSFNNFVEQSKYFISGKVLDLGCGNGLVAKCLKSPRMKSLELCDVMDYRDSSVKNWRFTIIPESGKLPYIDEEFDSVLAITVLHHAPNPKELLQEVNRICKKRFYLMETLVGVDSDMKTDSGSNSERKRLLELEKMFAALGEVKQMMHASFQDWFYNCVVQGDVAVPMNFASDSEWQKLFSEMGVKLSAKHMIGFDQRTSGEYHVIYVCEKR